MEAVDEDDFGDLYADVERQATSAISAIQALNGLSSDAEITAEDSDSLDVNEEVVSANGAEEKEESEDNGQLNVTESGSDSEDDFDILLNDDTAKDSNIREKLSCNVELRAGNWINEEENGEELENYFGVGGKEGLTNGGHSPLHKYGKSPSAKHSSYLEMDASIGGPSYCSALNKSDRKADSVTSGFSTRSIVNQNGHNFFLPRSRIILDINIDAFDYKPWRHPGADLTDYFNFGLNEDSWKRYCNNLHQEIDSKHAASVTMNVPDKAAKFEQERTASPADENFPTEQPREMPKGKPIEVLDGIYRLPSADTMYPIERDSDVIIQIPVQNFQDNCLILNEVPFDQSANCPHEAAVKEVASGDVEDLRIFSSDVTEKSMKRKGLAGGTCEPVSGRSFHGKPRRCTSSSSPSETSKGGGVCGGSEEYKDHPKRAHTNSESGFRNAVKVDLHHGKDFGISSSSICKNKYFERRNNFKFHERKHGRMSVLESRLDDASDSYMSGGEFYNTHDYKRRSPMMDPCVFDKENNNFYDDLPKYYSNSEKRRLFNCPQESPYDAYPHGRGHQDIDFDSDQGQSLIPKGKQHFMEFFAKEMDILESSQFFDDQFCTRRKRKAEEDYFNGGFITEHSYPDDFTRDEIRSIPCYERVADHMETKYARHLPYDRREYAKSLVMNERKHGSHETFFPATYDEMGGRFTRDGFLLNTYKEQQNTSWGNSKSATSPRDDVFQRYGSLKRLHRMEHCSNDFEYDMITEKSIFMDELPKRVKYQKSEVLSWDELDYNSDIPYDCLQADMTHSNVIGRYKKRVKMHSSCGRERLVNGRELDSRRHRLPKVDESHRRFDQNPNIITREKFQQMFPRCWGSSDSLMAVGDRKSSRYFEAESLASLSGFEYLDSNDYLEKKRKSKGLHKSRFPRIHKTDKNRGRKFPTGERNDYLDIKKGQIVAQDFAQKPISVKKRHRGHKTIGQETAIAESPRIKELLKKMEKRRERFNCPTVIEYGSEKAKSFVNYANGATTDAEVQRPARKRRWVGN